MADYPIGYDPSQADYISARDQAIGAGISLAGFAAAGVIIWFSAAAVAAGVTTAGNEVAIGSSAYVGVDSATAALIEAASLTGAENEAEAMAAAQLLIEQAGMTQEQIMAIKVSLALQAIEAETAAVFNGAVTAFFPSGL